MAPEPVPRSPESVPKCVGTGAQVLSEPVPRWLRNRCPSTGGIRRGSHCSLCAVWGLSRAPKDPRFRDRIRALRAAPRERPPVRGGHDTRPLLVQRPVGPLPDEQADGRLVAGPGLREACGRRWRIERGGTLDEDGLGRAPLQLGLSDALPHARPPLRLGLDWPRARLERSKQRLLARLYHSGWVERPFSRCFWGTLLVF